MMVNELPVVRDRTPWGLEPNTTSFIWTKESVLGAWRSRGWRS